MTKYTKTWQYQLTFPFLLLLALLVVGCGGQIDQTVTLYKDETWAAEMSIRLPAEAVALLGSTTELDQSIEEGVAEIQAMGADASWSSRREDTTLIYTIESSGDGYAVLQEAVFGGNAEIYTQNVGGEEQIYFAYDGGGDLSGAFFTLTLIGGEIISTNGQQIDDSTVQWANMYGTMEAVLVGKSRFNIWLILIPLVLLGGIGVVALAGGGLVFLSRRPAFCPKCGAQMAQRAKFCPSCGHAR